MCTVTFVPVGDGAILTSNRDEWYTRGRAIVPEKYRNKNRLELLYPKDKDRGGSWIVVNNNGAAGILLNGAFQPHLRKENYHRSRGKVLLEIMNANDPLVNWDQIYLEGIEPFTLVLYTGAQLNECRWDGIKKYRFVLCSMTAYIWSSVTLYDAGMTKQREEWFSDWWKGCTGPEGREVMQFHLTAGAGDPECSLVMDRTGKIATVSITSVHLSVKKARMTHFDLRSGQQYITNLPLVKPSLMQLK